MKSKARLEMIEAAGRWCRRLGLSRSAGQIYGLLYLSLAPLTLDDIASLLGISKASASLGTRQLHAWGAIRQTWVPGDRRDYFEVLEDLGSLLRHGFEDLVKPRLDASRKRLEVILAAVEAEGAQGTLSREECRVYTQRLRTLCRLQKKLQGAAPLLMKLF